MSRVPLLDRMTSDPEVRAYFASVEQWLKPMPGPRGGGTVTPQCWRAWAHAPELAAWLFEGGRLFLSKNRWGLEHVALRQLAIVTLTRRMNCRFAYTGHWPLCEQAGITREQYDALITDPQVARTSALFDKEQRFIITYADELALRGSASNELYGEVIQRYTPRGAIELTAILGFYSMQSINLNFIDVAED